MILKINYVLKNKLFKIQKKKKAIENKEINHKIIGELSLLQKLLDNFSTFSSLSLLYSSSTVHPPLFLSYKLVYYFFLRYITLVCSVKNSLSYSIFLSDFFSLIFFKSLLMLFSSQRSIMNYHNTSNFREIKSNNGKFQNWKSLYINKNTNK